MGRFSGAARAVAVLTCLLTVACGKKGPPLAPIVRIPAPVDQIAVRRVGSDVYVTMTVPRQNIDLTMPADVTRIDVFGYTGRVAPPRARFANLGTFVASIPVVPVPPPDAVAPPPPDPNAGGIQGMPVTVVDTLTADELAQGPVDPPLASARAAAPPTTPAKPVAAPAPMPLRRFYMAFAFGPRNRPGPPGPAAELTLGEIPLPPVNLAALQTPGGVSVTWEPVGGLIAYLIGSRELPREEMPFVEGVTPPAPAVVLSGAGIAPLPEGATRYHVYREVAPDPLALPGPASPTIVPWRAVTPAPAAPPTAALAFEEPAEFERERCYTVRTVRGDAPAGVESDASPRVCIRPVDVFPPAQPAAPTAVAAEGAISLIWEPSPEADVGGYVVLRGEAGDATLAPLTQTPVFETSYRDTAVKPGVRYVYAVQAIDTRVPLGNVSAPSAPVEETAR
jgi:hypothetical protein